MRPWGPTTKGREGVPALVGIGGVRRGWGGIQHGAHLSIRNKKGQTVLEAAKQEHGQQWVDVLNKAIRESAQH
jgi:hypothetical protein